MEVCKICGQHLEILSGIHTEKHGLTIEEYRKEYGNNKVNPFRTFKIPPKRKITECEKFDCARKFKKQAY